MKTCWNVVTESCLATGPGKHQIALSQGCYLSLWQGSHSIGQHTLDAEQKLVGDQIYCGHSGDKGKILLSLPNDDKDPLGFPSPPIGSLLERILWGIQWLYQLFFPLSTLTGLQLQSHLCEEPLVMSSVKGHCNFKFILSRTHFPIVVPSLKE